MTPQAFLFDFDGTLIDSNNVHIDAWLRAFHEHGHTDVTRETLRAEIGKGGDQLIPAILGSNIDAHEHADLSKIHDLAYEEIAKERSPRVFPGAIDLLETLRRRSIRLALVTSSKQGALELTQKRAGVDLLGHFDSIITSDDVEQSKP